MKSSKSIILLLGLSAVALASANAALVDFTGVDLSSVSSPSGQTFNYTVDAGPAVGTLNVRLLSGDISSLQTGSSPDPTGFYALQSSPNLAPATFRFTFDTARAFQIDENESQATIEVNAFTLSSGSWTLLSATNTTPTISGSTITFVADNNSPPYGDYSIAGTGSFFDYKITNSPGFPVYGSAISVNVVPEPSAALLISVGLAALWLRRRTLRSHERNA